MRRAGALVWRLPLRRRSKGPIPREPGIISFDENPAVAGVSRRALPLDGTAIVDAPAFDGVIVPEARLALSTSVFCISIACSRLDSASSSSPDASCTSAAMSSVWTSSLTLSASPAAPSRLLNALSAAGAVTWAARAGHGERQTVRHAGLVEASTRRWQTTAFVIIRRGGPAAATAAATAASMNGAGPWRAGSDHRSTPIPASPRSRLAHQDITLNQTLSCESINRVPWARGTGLEFADAPRPRPSFDPGARGCVLFLPPPPPPPPKAFMNISRSGRSGQ